MKSINDFVCDIVIINTVQHFIIQCNEYLGHIGFNEPGTPFEELTHIVDLTPSTIEANARFFDNDMNKVPKQAISMGIGTIMKSKKILMVVSGTDKAEAVKGMVEGPVTTDMPASVLQNHPDVTVVVDEAAASLLSK